MSNNFEPKTNSFYSYFIENEKWSTDIVNTFQKIIEKKREYRITPSNRDLSENYSSDQKRIRRLNRLCFSIIKNKNQKPKLSLKFKILNFWTNWRWKNDEEYLQKEIKYRLEQLSRVSYLGCNELGELLSFGIRVHRQDRYNTPTVPFNILDRCLNLQEFYSNEPTIDFKFAEKLVNLVVVCVFQNDSNAQFGVNQDKRIISNIQSLNSCLLLNLEDSYLEDFSKIPPNVLFLNLSNSNFKNINSITHLKKLEYLDIHRTLSKDLEGISKLESLKILNLSQETHHSKYDEETNSTDISFFKELIKLENLSLLIIGENDFNTISQSKTIYDSLKNIILVITNNKSRYLWTSDLAEILNVSDRNKGEKYSEEIDILKFIQFFENYLV
ncbi:hypothetical protein N9672_01830 [Flavobacteriaceae bacterium]|nr:hypothetical protein [Flavobacteriaceae bacterium]MDB4183074.1 hypothetical protein [Flavobacteriaceae bacterium]